nr:reverse transcriptase domain-containing protein [Tanacetum cinerariifolium]
MEILLESTSNKLMVDLQVTPSKPRRMTKPYLSHRFIANCLNAENLKIEVKADIGESSLIRPESVQETIDKVVLIKEKLKAAGDYQKSYADNRHKPLEFEVRDQVLLKVLSWKDVVHFRKKEMLAPRDVRPFEIIKGIDPMAY